MGESVPPVVWALTPPLYSQSSLHPDLFTLVNYLESYNYSCY